MKYISLLLLILIFTGCSINQLGSSQSMYEINRLEQKFYNYDFSTGSDVGLLVITSQPAAMQLLVENYTFKIDGHEINVYKNSITQIKLDAGMHKVEGWVRGFGFSTSRTIDVPKDVGVYIIFQGSLDILSKGRFWTAEDLK